MSSVHWFPSRGFPSRGFPSRGFPSRILLATASLLFLLDACGGTASSPQGKPKTEKPSVPPPASGPGSGSGSGSGAGTGAPKQAPPADDGFRLQFKLTDGETSKDSHQIRWACRIEGLQAVYSGPYGECERGQCPHKEIRFALSGTQRAEVVALLRSDARFRNFEEVRPGRGIGKWVQASLQVTYEKISLQMRVDGMTNAWGKTDGKSVLSKDARGYLSALGDLRRRLATFAAGHFAGYHVN